MKKVFMFIVVPILVSTSAYAQIISQQWIKNYRWTDHGGGLTRIMQTSDGGYLGAGLHVDTDSISALKLDYNGDVSWLKTYSGSLFWNDLYTAVEAIDGGYIVAGTTASFGGWILKLGSNGDIVWQKAYQGVAQFDSIQKTTDGGYIATGTSGFDPGNADVIVLKLNNNGDIFWQKSYNLTEYEQGDIIRQTVDGGYIIAGHTHLNPSDYNIWVLKLDSTGNIVWQKTYGELVENESPLAIVQTFDGGYIMSGYQTFGEYSVKRALVIKLDSNGDVIWKKLYRKGMTVAFSVQENTIGEYTVLVNNDGGSHGDDEIWILQLDDTGDIIWQKTYGGDDRDFAYYLGKTMDGGYVIIGVSTSFDPVGFTIFKLNTNGEIPNCDIISTTDVIVSEPSISVQDTNATIELFPITIVETDAFPQDIAVETSVICQYNDPNDIDGDGVAYNPDGAMASSMYGSSFLADEDNCPNMPNGPFLGTCIAGSIGGTCIANEACGVGGICSMNQEDIDGDGIGDVCDSSTEQIPTLSEWGLIIFMTIVMGIGVVTILRRRMV